MIDQIEKPKIERVEVGENNRYGKFVVNPLERGFGQTLGNSLRRVLLNSLPGVAATQASLCETLHGAAQDCLHRCARSLRDHRGRHQGG